MSSCRRRPSLAIALLIFSWLGIEASVSAQGVYGVPVFVQNAADVARTQDPVATGFPLPQGSQILDPNVDLRLLNDQGQPVPVQFKVLSRWGGPREDGTKEAKWVLIEFLADVPADSFRVYSLNYGVRAQGQVQIQEYPTEIHVNSGAAEFVFDKVDFSLVKGVRIGGQPVLGAPAMADMRDVFGNLVDPALTEVVVEEAGSVRTVVRMRAELTGTGLDVTVRQTVWSGSTELQTEFRLENNGSYGELSGTGSQAQHSWFSDLNLAFHLASASADIVTPDHDLDTNGAFYELHQDYDQPLSPNDMLSGFHFAEMIGGSLVANGSRHAGGVAINGNGVAVVSTVDRFWQNFPKSFASGGGSLLVGLWPSFGNGPLYYGQYGSPGAASLDVLAEDHYRLEGGRWKTYKVNTDFRLGAQGFTPAEVAHEVACTEKPLMALLPLDVPFKTFAFGQPLVERRAWGDVSRNRFEQMVQILADDQGADSIPNLGKVGLPSFRNRGGTWGGDQFYGWTNYGDVVWGDGYCSLHYDMPWSTLVNYWRTGDYAFYDMGRDMAAHRRDYDQYHSDDPGDWKRGGQFYEKGWTHGNYFSMATSHTWVRGLLLHYVMTGDEGSREAALEVGEFIANQNPQNWNGLWGSRILGWQVEGLMSLWNYIGDPAYLNLAASAIGQFQNQEQTDGGNGYVLNDATSPPSCQSWMHAIVMSAVGKYYLSTLDPSVLPLMSRMATWLHDDCVRTWPSGPMTNRTAGKIWTGWDGTTGAASSTHHQWSLVEAFSYAALCLHDQTYLDAAKSLFDSAARYHQKNGWDDAAEDWTDPASFNAITFKPSQYPNSETKVIGNIALWGQAFMAAELIWNSQF